MTEQITFGSACSGIEAASVAFGPLNWRAAWFAEIAPFPAAVLAHHYPEVPNLTDLTTLPARVAAGEVVAPDVLVGGTPCQAFSVAGLRQSLNDARGNLSLVFCDLANAIDTARAVRGLPPSVIKWENVPGVLTTKDNAFGCFLAGLAGEDDPLEPPGGKWAYSGVVHGPSRTVAWRTFDAQYFGVAQRRRRVFVVASARDDFDPVSVLFEFDGVRRDFAPRREAGQVAPTIPSRSTAGGGLGTDFDCDGGVIAMAHGQGGAEIGFDRSPCLTCNHEAPIAAIPTDGVRYAYYSHDYAGDRITDVSGVNPALTASPSASGNLNVLAPTIVPCNPLEPVAVAHVGIMPTMTCGGGHAASHNQVSGQMRDAYVVPTTAMQVRRLTPRECERLQGFPDDYTLIPWRNKPAEQCPDGPRYKALGNSWAVPNARWIGARINSQLKGQRL